MSNCGACDLGIEHDHDKPFPFDWYDINGYADEVEEPVWDMFLCETKKVYLRPGIIYRFRVDKNCPDCVDLDVYS
jgi:hypothetical protein